MKITELVQSVDQAASRLGLTPETIRNRCLVGSIPCIKIAGRWKIPDRSGIALRLWEELPGELTVAEVQQILGIKKHHLDQLLTSGTLPAQRNEGKLVVSKVRLMEFLGLNATSPGALLTGTLSG